MTGYQPIVIPFNYRGIHLVEYPGIEPGVPEGGGFTVHCITIDASTPMKVRYLPRIGSTCNFPIAFRRQLSKTWWSLKESNLLPATPLNNGYQVTAGNGEQAPIIFNTLQTMSVPALSRRYGKVCIKAYSARDLFH
jgi:hypothetical protein